MEVKFERQALYEQVWTTPLSKLGPSYGLSDNGLRKVCKSLNIPLPVAGHWAKVAAGHVIPRPKLPVDAPKQVFVSYPPQPLAPGVKNPEDQVWYARWEAFEAEPTHRIHFIPSPEQWHTAVAPFVRLLENAAKKHAALIIERDAYREKRARLRNPGPDFGSFKYDHLDTGLLSDAPLYVTLTTYERALAILNAMCVAAHDRQFKASFDREANRFQIKIEDTILKFAIRERPARVTGPRTGFLAGIGGNEMKLVARDKLAIVVEGSLINNFEVVDGDSGALQDRLNEAFLKLYRGVIRVRQASREFAIARERERLRQIDAAERKRIQEEQDRIRAAEEKRRAELIQECAQWDSAMHIRAYVAHIEQAGSIGSDLREWAAWALRVADERDPTTARLSLDSEATLPPTAASHRSCK